ncbi:MAG TPA: 2-C-methyl-D-erythritol 2,4-cyclodiphosphate synthase [Bacteroidales bacterium]
MYKTRVGFGYDVHQLVSERRLVIGGVEIPHFKGAAGHSDADVLLHALADALLGAAGLEDIGTHFPDSDKKFKDIDSRIILAKVVELVSKIGFEIENVDSTVVLQQPKIKDFVPEIKKQISGLLGIDIGEISVKAKTTESLGFIGKEEGIAAYAVILISRKL